MFCVWHVSFRMIFYDDLLLQPARRYRNQLTMLTAETSTVNTRLQTGPIAKFDPCSAPLGGNLALMSERCLPGGRRSYGFQAPPSWALQHCGGTLFNAPTGDHSTIERHRSVKFRNNPPKDIEILF